jgi:hypothetical protein
MDLALASETLREHINMRLEAQTGPRRLDGASGAIRLERKVLPPGDYVVGEVVGGVEVTPKVRVACRHLVDGWLAWLDEAR